MKETVPPTMAGITFLSGGQSEEEATQHIQAMAEYMPDAPWNVSFSFARALQSSVLKTWGGKKENEQKQEGGTEHEDDEDGEDRKDRTTDGKIPSISE